MAKLTRHFPVVSAFRPTSLRIERTEAQQLISHGAVLVDVRRIDDDRDPPAGALRIAPDMIPGRLDGFRRDVPIVLACT